LTRQGVCIENLIRFDCVAEPPNVSANVALICFLLNVVASLFKSKSRLEAENAALRHQLIVLQRKVRGRVSFTNSDRLFFVQLDRWFPSVVKAVTIIRPETLVRWHRDRLSPLLALEIALPGKVLGLIINRTNFRLTPPPQAPPRGRFDFGVNQISLSSQRP
jgi:hypothetical protein